MTDKELLLTPEEYPDTTEELGSLGNAAYPNQIWVAGVEAGAKAQLAKVQKLRLDRPELREKVEGLPRIKSCAKCPYWKTCPRTKLPQINGFDEMLCKWEADQILALSDRYYATKIEEQLELLRAQVVVLNKKLDDREADLIEAKKQERERIILYLSESGYWHLVEGIRQALKGG